jgi:YceI-like domain
MNRRFLLAFLFLALPLSGQMFARTAAAQASSQWVLEQSTLTYHVSHPLHQVEGVSHAARGKGVCSGGQCEFLIAVPVKSFDSGDSNRDLHMLQVVRGGEFPIVSVRTQLPERAGSETTIYADLEVQFAGQTAQYKQVAFQLTINGNEARISGTIPAKLSDFKIPPPSLLAMPIKNEIPVRVEMTWRKEN